LKYIHHWLRVQRMVSGTTQRSSINQRDEKPLYGESMFQYGTKQE
jgi:hypothetical protein